MKYKGIIFDFNGTLFWDTPLHNQAWDMFLAKHQINLTDQEKNERIHGKNNRDIFNGIFDRTIEGKELDQFIDEKESIYRQICLDIKTRLAPGVTNLFDALKQAGVPMTIATASGLDNVVFFFEQFNLNKWFNFDLLVYDNGKLRSKPMPDFFLKAMKKLELSPNECIIFEDSFAGIAAAENAKAGKIIIVDSTKSDYSKYPYEVIDDFGQFNRKRVIDD